MDAPPELTIVPLTPERWGDLESLFGKRGACSGCWCMWHRLPSAEYSRTPADRRREAFRECVEAGPPPGLLAYAGDRPIGWCALAPRESLLRLRRSRTWKAVDEQPVWAVHCFYVAPDWRRRGVTRALLRGAIRYAREQGVELLEAYPKEPAPEGASDTSLYHGAVSVFLAEGFEEVARRSAPFPIVRLRL